MFLQHVKQNHIVDVSIRLRVKIELPHSLVLDVSLSMFDSIYRRFLSPDFRLIWTLRYRRLCSSLNVKEERFVLASITLVIVITI